MVATYTGDGQDTVVVPLGADGTASLSFQADNKGRRSGFAATFEGLDAVCTTDTDCGHGLCQADGTCRCEVGWTGLACTSAHCLLNTVLSAGSSGASGRIVSQATGESVAPMAECAYTVTEPVINASEHVGFRLRFDEPLSLEPGGGDALTVGSTEISNATCTSDDACSEAWQDGNCVNGFCQLLEVVDLPGAGDLTLLLQTDRSDVGGEMYTGLNASWYSTTSCPAGKASIY